jgi:hypothetical protein
MSEPEEPQPISLMSRIGKWLFWLAVVMLLPWAFKSFESLRGERAWGKMLTEMAAQGHLTNYSALIPPPIPAEQNFYKTEIAQRWLPAKGSKEPDPVDFPREPRFEKVLTQYPYRLAQLKSLPRTSAGGDTNQPSLEALEKWFDQWEPQFGELHEATKRPHARLDGDYSDPFEAPADNYLRFRSLAQILASRPLVDLLAGNQQRAVRDLGTLKGLMTPLGELPHSLVSGMIRVAFGGVYANAVAEMLAEKTLQDPELKELQGQLSGLDVITVAWRAIHETERLSMYRYEEKWSGPGLLKSTGMTNEPVARALRLSQGLFWQNQINASRSLLGYFPVFDPKARLFNVSALESAERNRKAARSSWNPYTRLNDWSPNGFRMAMIQAVYNQTKIDQALIACALERYRLAKGSYPKTLAELTPTYLEKRPHDLFTGKDFIYRSESTNSFKLYSVGYNGVDDGGMEGIKRWDKEAPDWVW